MAENDCGGVRKSPLAERGRRAVCGGEADAHYHHVAEPNPSSPLLSSPALPEE